MTLAEVACIVRSKNAGPLQLTIDILAGDRTGYELLRSSPALGAERIAELYGVAVSEVALVHVQVALAIKITLPRPIVAGSPGDRDVYGAQQHRPLLDLVL